MHVMLLRQAFKILSPKLFNIQYSFGFAQYYFLYLQFHLCVYLSELGPVHYFTLQVHELQMPYTQLEQFIIAKVYQTIINTCILISLDSIKHSQCTHLQQRRSRVHMHIKHFVSCNYSASASRESTAHIGPICCGHIHREFGMFARVCVFVF